MNKLTVLEAMALEVVEYVQDFLTRRDASRPEFMEIMGMLRDLRVRLENKKFGCPTGRHAMECECKEPDIYL